MPELPEVETIRRSLLPLLVGRRVRAAVVRERRLRQPIQTDFAIRVIGQRFEDVRRRGKYLLFDLDRGDCMLVHLGMSGKLSIHDPPRRPGAHDHVWLRLSGGAQMVLTDPRRFGLLKVIAMKDVAALPELRAMGVDPLQPGLAVESLSVRLRSGRRAIKSVLLDQGLIAGLGNIYASESLFRAGIRPTRRAHRVRRIEIAALLAAIREVLEEAIAMGGSSISDYRDGTGRAGYFQLRLSVYGRAGEPCRRCGTAIRRVVQVGRSSFFCPRCQR